MLFIFCKVNSGKDKEEKEAKNTFFLFLCQTFVSLEVGQERVCDVLSCAGFVFLVFPKRERRREVFSSLFLFERRVFVVVGIETIFGKMIQLQVHLQLPCYDFCFLY